jgi:hypothetical protein
MAEDIALQDAMAEAAAQAGEEGAEAAMRTAADSIGANLGVDASVEGSGADAQIEVNGKPIDPVSISVDFTDGNIQGALDQMGVDTSPGTQGGDFVEKQKASFEASEQGQTKAALSPSETPAGLEDLDDNPTKEQFDEQVSKDADLKAKVEKMDAEIKELKGEAKTPEELSRSAKFMKWLEGVPKLKLVFGALFLAALIFFCIDLHDFIKGVQNAENGCWAIQKDGSKCKIAALTCNSDDLQQPNGSFMGIPADTPSFRTCQSCVDMNCTSGDWIPALPGACACGATLDFSGYQYLNTQNTNSCVKCGTKESYFEKIERWLNTIRTKEKMNSGLPPACPNTSRCVSKNEACAKTMNSDCSAWCETSALKLKPGTVIQCTNKSFAQAAGDAFPDILKGVLGGLGSLLGPLEKILMWVALGIVVLVIGYVLIKEVVHYVGTKKNAEPVEMRPVTPNPRFREGVRKIGPLEKGYQSDYSSL